MTAKATLPLVVVPVISARGAERVPVIVPPAAKVIVNVVVTGSEASAVMGTDAVIVPFPIPPVKFVVPLIVMPLAPRAAVAFTVNVVLIVAAGAAAQTTRAKAKLAHARFINLFRVLHS